MDLRDMQNVDLAKLTPGEPLVATTASRGLSQASSGSAAEATLASSDLVTSSGPALTPPSDDELASTPPTTKTTPKSDASSKTSVDKKPGLTWRLATGMRDLELTRDISLEFHRRSHFAHIPFSHKKRDDFLSPALERGSNKSLILCEYSSTGDPKDAVVVGGAVCGVGEFMFGIDYLICTVYVFYVKEDLKSLVRGKAAIGLVRAVKAWAKAKGAGEVMVHVTADTVQNDRFWRKVGGKVLGGSYVV